MTLIGLPAFAQTPSPTAGELPLQAKSVRGIALPVPKEIFQSLDQFRDANWRAAQRPEIAHWRSQGDPAQIATLLGVVIAEGFIAMEAQDPAEVKNMGNEVLKLARGLGVEKRALSRSRSIMDFAERGDWSAARNEWDGVLSDLENGMIQLRSSQDARLVSLGGWVRGTEALSALILQNFSAERAELLRQPGMLDFLEKELGGLNSKTQSRPIVTEMLNGIRKIRSLLKNENGPLSEETVRQIHQICQDLVKLSSRRPS